MYFIQHLNWFYQYFVYFNFLYSAKGSGVNNTLQTVTPQTAHSNSNLDFIINFIIKKLGQLSQYNDYRYRSIQSRNHVSISDRNKRLIFSAKHPDGPCSPPNFLFSGHLELFLWGSWLEHEADQSPLFFTDAANA
jgi:hypothetical protein